MKSPSLSDLEDQYQRYLSDVRSLSQRSIASNMWTFGRVRDFMKSRRVRSARRVSLDLVYAFLEDYARGHSRSSVVQIRWHVSNMLRFLHFARILPRDIAKEMIAPCSWSLAEVPEAFSEDDVARMLANLRLETPYDLRERAIVLLLLYCGLRTGELTTLGLDDINWRKKTLTVRERKNRVSLVLPLLGPVEEALRDYVTRSRRPDAESEWLFVPVRVRQRAPLTCSLMNMIVKQFLRRCGLEGSARNFRHTLATRLINDGVSLETIAAVLGHSSTKSTLTYTKVHVKALREVAENYSLLL